ncbi:hypothetical protein DXG03_007331 [Asterophora parasitica]|uniref:Uncharacterized protein n=1 Tax=Asterophora parasitica TaxID=117018 RepID=A0A9P7G844_9AGAR|nr:hypothetical protein DXG03_007331 [Asterophora parasitica]
MNMLPVQVLRRRALLRVGCATHRGYQTKAKVPHRTIQTLNPDLLEPSDFVDLSNKRWATVYAQSATGFLRYPKNRQRDAQFPSNAKGFLYLHRPPSLPPIAAEIRLRLTPEPNPTLFSTGADLLCGSIPWSIDLPQLVKVKSYAPFEAQVVSDGLIDGGFMDSLKLAWEDVITRRADTQTLYTLAQPFEINLEDTSTLLGILTTRAQGCIIFDHLFRDTRAWLASKHPYRGRILAHFEISPLAQHSRPASRPPVLVIRVLKILTPIESVPGYDMYLPIPAEGGLLSKRRTGTIFFDLEKPSQRIKDLMLLVEGDRAILRGEIGA